MSEAYGPSLPRRLKDAYPLLTPQIKAEIFWSKLLGIGILIGVPVVAIVSGIILCSQTS